MIRTVSMLPAATEIVGALGLTDWLVAVSHECDHPAEANRRPRVTHCDVFGRGLPSADIDRWVSEQLAAGRPLYTIDEPLLRGLAPDLILTQRLCDVCAPAYGSVRALADSLPAPPAVLNLEPRSLEGVFDNVAAVAAAMGRPDAAPPVVAALRARVDRVRKMVAGRPTPTAFVMEWADPIFNAGHWTPELVALAGGVPVLSSAGAESERVPWDRLRAADPDVLVVACCGHGVERNGQDMPLLEALPGWGELAAVRAGRVFVADGMGLFSRPGPRVVDTLELLAAVLHPEACRPVTEAGRVMRWAAGSR